MRSRMLSSSAAGPEPVSTSCSNSSSSATKSWIALSELVAAGTSADQILASVLDASGLVAELEASEDPQDATRLENLVEFLSVAGEFVAAAHTEDVGPGSSGLLGPGPATEDAYGSLLAAGSPEPDDSLPAFLERIALVADSDQIPDAEGGGVVTLMTLHTAKGLEFPVVFLTGFEDGIFPHSRAVADPVELEEERRLAYVGITRARERLYLTRATVRVTWGAPQYNPPSRFLEEIPAHLLDWRRLGAEGATWAATASRRTERSWRSVVMPRAVVRPSAPSGFHSRVWDRPTRPRWISPPVVSLT